MRSINEEEFEDLFESVKQVLVEEKFLERNYIDYEGRFWDLLKHFLMVASDDDLLSDVLIKVIKAYRQIEIDDAIDSLQEEGLIRMVVDENGRLGYQFFGFEEDEH